MAGLYKDVANILYKKNQRLLAPFSATAHLAQAGKNTHDHRCQGAEIRIA